MKNLLQSLGSYFEFIPERQRSRKILVWTAFIFLTLLMGSGMTRLKSDLSFESFFAADDPVKLAYNEMRSIFGSDEIIYIMYRARDNDVLSDQSLSTIRMIQNELEAAIDNTTNPIEHLTEVRSLINVDFLEAQGDNLVTRKFVGNRNPQNKIEREFLRQQALDETTNLSGVYISPDSKHGGLIIRTDFNSEIAVDDGLSFEEEAEFSDGEQMNPDIQEDVDTFKKTGMAEYKTAVDHVNRILDQEKYTRVFEYKKVGTPVQMAWAMQAMGEEMGTVMLWSFIIVALSLLVLFRSLSAIVWPLLIVAISAVYTLGFMGWVGIPATSFTQIIIFLILAIGVSDGIHILSGYVYYRRLGENHESALQTVYKKSGVAILLTTLTTSIGLLALTLVPIEPIRFFGVASAFGLWVALGITVYVLPLMLELWAPRKKRITVVLKPSFLQRWLAWMEGLAQKRKKLIIISFSLLGAVLLYGGTQVVVDSNDIKALKPTVRIRQAVEAVDATMAGASNLQIMIDTGKRDGLKDPAILTRIDSIQNRLEQQYPDVITQSVSLANIVKNSYRLLNEGQMTFYSIPRDQRLLSQVLFLFEMSNATDRRQMVTDTYKKGRISLTLKNIGSAEGNILFNNVAEMLNETFAPVRVQYPDFKITLTGQLAMSTRLSTYMTFSQLQSFGIAFAVITLLMPLIMGSFTIGLIAMIPNLFPVVAVFGVMGFLKIPLEMHTLLVAPIIIGVAVDDTIHFLTHFQMERAHGASVIEAIRQSFREVGQAITYTSIVLSCGFLIFVSSSSLGLTYFGYLSALAMSTALACDLLMLPAILNRRS